MTLIEAWVSTPLAAAAGWTLLHSIWQGAIIAALLAASLLVLRSPRARYAAAVSAMLAVFGAFAFTLTRMTPEPSYRIPAPADPPNFASNVQSRVDSLIASDATLGEAAPWLALFWILGVLVVYLRQAAGWVMVSRLRRRGVWRAPERWQVELERLKARLRISRAVLLLESCIVDIPIVLGHLRPVILMPVGLLAGMPASQVETILLHELAHVRRADYLVNVLQRFVEGLFFYHPAIWWISRVIRAEREHCCDDLAVTISGNAHEYAEALAALERNRWPDREPALAATGGSLVKRIRRLLFPPTSNSAWPPIFATAMLLIAASGALLAWQAQQPQQGTAAKPGDDSPYAKWLNEDVAYITTKDERAAFLRLTTDEERQEFIWQFWLRRDPTPSTPKNEMKEEHYRRISYANIRFATSDLAGWRTDRGRMYILYGPPDENESHPNGSAQIQFPFEAWKYRYVEGLGNNLFFLFIDRARTGEYRLAPSSAR